MNEPSTPRRLTYAQREALQEAHRRDFPEPPVSRVRPIGRVLPPPTAAEAADDARFREGRSAKEATRMRLAVHALRASSPLNTTTLRLAMGLGGNRTDLAGQMLRKWMAEGHVHRLQQGGRETSRSGGALWALGRAPRC